MIQTNILIELPPEEESHHRLDLLHNHYRLHQLVHESLRETAKAHPEITENHKPDSRILWKIVYPTDHEVFIIITAPHSAECLDPWKRETPANYQINATTVDLNKLTDNLTPGQELPFHFTVNPVICHNDRTHKPPMTPLESVTDIRQWLHDRSEKLGANFTIDTVHPRTVGIERRGEKFPLKLADITGRMTVTDPETLHHTLTHGYGRGKGFGSGMLLTNEDGLITV